MVSGLFLSNRTRGGSFSNWERFTLASQHAGDLTLPGPRGARRSGAGSGSHRQTPLYSRYLLRPPSPLPAAHARPRGPLGRLPTTLTRTFFPCPWLAVRRPRCVCPAPRLGPGRYRSPSRRASPAPRLLRRSPWSFGRSVLEAVGLLNGIVPSFAQLSLFLQIC